MYILFLFFCFVIECQIDFVFAKWHRTWIESIFDYGIRAVHFSRQMFDGSFFKVYINTMYKYYARRVYKRVAYKMFVGAGKVGPSFICLCSQ